MSAVARILVFAMLAAILAATATAGAGAADSERPYRLRSGDRIRLIVFGHDRLSGEFRLDHLGSISMPLAGRVRLGDTTARQAEAEIARALRPDYLKYPRVSVEVVGHRPVYVVGEVESPGRYAYARGLTVMGAVALAGGYTDDADRNGVRIRRAADPRGRAEAVTGGVDVLPGDTVRVPARGLF